MFLLYRSFTIYSYLSRYIKHFEQAWYALSKRVSMSTTVPVYVVVKYGRFYADNCVPRIIAWKGSHKTRMESELPSCQPRMIAKVKSPQPRQWLLWRSSVRARGSSYFLRVATHATPMCKFCERVLLLINDRPHLRFRHGTRREFYCSRLWCWKEAASKLKLEEAPLKAENDIVATIWGTAIKLGKL